MNEMCLRIKFQFSGCFDLLNMCKINKQTGTVHLFGFSFRTSSYKPINKALVLIQLGCDERFTRRILTLEFILCALIYKIKSTTPKK